MVLAQSVQSFRNGLRVGGNEVGRRESFRLGLNVTRKRLGRVLQALSELCRSASTGHKARGQSAGARGDQVTLQDQTLHAQIAQKKCS